MNKQFHVLSIVIKIIPRDHDAASQLVNITMKS